jgi:hypothetical protein
MKISKRIGVYLNYQHANIIAFSTELIESKTIASNFSHADKKETLKKSEKAMNQMEHHDHLAYFKKIGEMIKDYDEAILFGPTKAKNELHNLLLADNHFSKIDVQIANTDDLTPKEQHDFVVNYFATKLTKPTF